MNKVLIVLMFILLGTSLIVVSNMGKEVQNSFVIEYQNNKNLALPDLTGKEAIAPNLFRLYNKNGIIIDYELNTGVFTIDGTKTSNFNYIITGLIPQGQYTLSYHYVSGILQSGTLYIGNTPEWNLYITNVTTTQQYKQYKTITQLTSQNYRLYFDFANSNTFNNYKFKLQLEKGSNATSYVSPKLIPVYKDNLTQQEKNEIGLGAFGGISKILKSIDNVIKPIGNFINGILNLFK